MISTRGTRWTMAAMMLAVMPHVAQMPPWLIAGLALIIAWRWWRSDRTYQPPHMILRVIITFAGVGAVVLAHGVLLGRRAATTLLTVMLVLKLLELVKLRDARLIVMTSFFLTATHFLFNQDLIYVPWMLACMLLGLATLRQLHEDSLQLTQQRFTNSATQPPSLLHLAGRIVLLAAPVSIALFMLFPRLATPLWGIPEYTLDGKSGLSDSMSPGRIQQMFLDDSPAFRARFQGARPSQQDLYWRGPVLWQYDGTTWSRGNLQRIDSSRIPDRSDTNLEYEIQLEPHERHWLFALDHPSYWPDEAFLTHDYQLLSRKPITTLMRYNAGSVSGYTDQAEGLSVYNRNRGLQLPSAQNPRTQALMSQWRTVYRSDAGLVQHALNWFREEPFYYSLEAPPLGANGVDEFLFDLRLGYCEYYASAFVVMMRAAGIPARVVTGYQGGTYNQIGGYLLIRQSDAHAWAEVWLPGTGWMRVDPTAMVSPDRVNYGPSAALDYSRGWHDWAWVNHLRTSLDAARNAWNQWVLSFDARRQQRLFNPFGVDNLKHQHLILILVVLMGVAGLLLHWLLQWQRTPASDPAQQLYRRGLRRLRRQGLIKEPGEGPREFASRIVPELERGGAEWRHLTDSYCRLRYADDQRQLARLRATLKQFRPRRRTPPAAGVQTA
ncbi:MAG: DUF3488 and transglutaminase-like domain-containing protein [Wenzhouxiangellaceae bacterium]